MTRIHVNQLAINKNAQDGGNRPVIEVVTDSTTKLVRGVEILGPSKVKYRNAKPDPGSARCWIETEAEVREV